MPVKNADPEVLILNLGEVIVPLSKFNAVPFVEKPDPSAAWLLAPGKLLLLTMPVVITPPDIVDTFVPPI